MKYPKGLTTEEKTVIFLSRMGRWNEWIDIKPLKAYIRSTERYRDDDITSTLELANITVKKENKGWATWFLDKMEHCRGTRTVYVENVVSPALIHILNKRRYIQVEDKPYICFWQHIEGE